jgi:uncharacterized protein YndB with AHSA1/START domain
MTNAAVATETREISNEKVFDAPRELVWKAWTDPDHIRHWWGPIGFTTTTAQFEFKPGGQWIHTMHGPDGTDYPNEITYKVIDEPSRIEYEHGGCPLFYTTVIFEDLGDKTRLSMTMLFNSTEDRDETAQRYGAIEGLEQTLGRLREYLGKN